MSDLNLNKIERAYARNGVLSITTPSCGCCSEYYSTNPGSCFSAWSIPVDDLIKYADKEQERIDALTDFIAQRVAENKDFVDFVPED
jgi:hypothetical protein